MTKISIVKKYIVFQEYTPVWNDININFEFSRNINLFQVTKISILQKYIDFQKYIPVSDEKLFNFE